MGSLDDFLVVMITMSSRKGCQSQQREVFANHLVDTIASQMLEKIVEIRKVNNEQREWKCFTKIKKSHCSLGSSECSARELTRVPERSAVQFDATYLSGVPLLRIFSTLTCFLSNQYLVRVMHDGLSAPPSRSFEK